MIIATEFAVAMRCPSCSKLDFHQVSRFAFSGKSNYKISCSCGSPKLIIGTKKRSQFWFQIPCVLCETNHLIYYKAKQLWSGEVTFFYCNETNIELGFFGPEEKVRAVSENYEDNLESLVEELGYDDYFYNPEIMFEVLNCLHDIAEDGFLYCECGSLQVEIDIFPDKIELQCKDCKTISVVYAENEEDLEKIRKVKKIELVKSGFKSLDNIDKGKKPRKKNSKRTK